MNTGGGATKASQRTSRSSKRTKKTKSKLPTLHNSSQRSLTTKPTRKLGHNTLSFLDPNTHHSLPSTSLTSASVTPHLSGQNGPSAEDTSPTTTSKAFVTIKKFTAQERKHLKSQKRGRTVFVPSYVHAKDLSQRLHVTLMQLHKAGTHFFPWWPRASERQLKRDGYSMLADLVLRFDESHLLLKSLGYNPVFEHTGIERIRNEHYNMAAAMQKLRNKGHNITPGTKKDFTDRMVAKGTGPEPIPESERPKHIQPKQPVVCIIGHVNHGKTTLLDKLRNTKLASHEDGGITQDLYAYQCDLGEEVQDQWNNKYRRNIITRIDENDPDYKKNDKNRQNGHNSDNSAHSDHSEDSEQAGPQIRITHAPLAHTIPSTPPNKELDPLTNYDDDTLLHVYQKVTFLDTPGHASFFDMRENGTLFSDLVVLVVSSTEGVCPQTLESIEYIKAFKLPVVVALTKTDLPNSNPKAVMKQLHEAGLNAVTFDSPDAFNQLTPPDEESDMVDIVDGSGRTRRGSFQSQRPKKHQITPCIPISALNGKNMAQFKESLMKSFMILKPQADVAAPPVGLVLESFKEEGGRGTVLRVLLSSGVIEKNDHFISGVFNGKVKDLRVYGDVTMNEFTMDPVVFGSENGKNGKNVPNGREIAQKLFPNANSSGIVPGTTVAGKLLNNEKFDIDNHKVHVNAKNKKTIINQDKSFAPTLRKPKLGLQVDYAIPGIPLDVVGLTGIAAAGDDIRIVPSSMLARTVSEARRMENEYPNQGRFQLGGIAVTDWTPPPMLFLADYKKNPNVLSKYVKADKVINPNKNRQQDGQLSDVDTDDYDGDDGDENDTEDGFNKTKRSGRRSKRTEFGKYNEDDDDDEEGSYDDDEEGSYDEEEEDGEYEDEEDDEQDHFNNQRNSKLKNQHLASQDKKNRNKGEIKKNILTMDGDDAAFESKANAKMSGLLKKKSAFSHNNPSTYSSSSLPDWNRIHEREFEYQRPFVIKGATAGGVKMIMDSIDAFNEAYPEKKIHLVHANQGSLTSNDLMHAASAVDTDLDPDMNCPVLLYRTKKPNPKLVSQAKKQGTEIFSYAVFDDLLKHMIGTKYYNEMFADSSNLRGFQAGASFLDMPLEEGEEDGKGIELQQQNDIQKQNELMKYGRDDVDISEEMAQLSQKRPVVRLAPGRRVKHPSNVPVKEETALEKAMRLEAELMQQRQQQKLAQEAYEERVKKQAEEERIRKLKREEQRRREEGYSDEEEEEEREIPSIKPSLARLPGSTRARATTTSSATADDVNTNDNSTSTSKKDENATNNDDVTVAKPIAPMIRPRIKLKIAPKGVVAAETTADIPENVTKETQRAAPSSETDAITTTTAPIAETAATTTVTQSPPTTQSTPKSAPITPRKVAVAEEATVEVKKTPVVEKMGSVIEKTTETPQIVQKTTETPQPVQKTSKSPSPPPQQPINPKLEQLRRQQQLLKQQQEEQQRMMEELLRQEMELQQEVEGIDTIVGNIVNETDVSSLFEDNNTVTDSTPAPTNTNPPQTAHPAPKKPFNKAQELLDTIGGENIDPEVNEALRNEYIKNPFNPAFAEPSRFSKFQSVIQSQQRFEDQQNAFNARRQRVVQPVVSEGKVEQKKEGEIEGKQHNEQKQQHNQQKDQVQDLEVVPPEPLPPQSPTKLPAQQFTPPPRKSLSAVLGRLDQVKREIVEGKVQLPIPDRFIKPLLDPSQTTPPEPILPQIVIPPRGSNNNNGNVNGGVNVTGLMDQHNNELNKQKPVQIQEQFATPTQPSQQRQFQTPVQLVQSVDTGALEQNQPQEQQKQQRRAVVGSPETAPKLPQQPRTAKEAYEMLQQREKEIAARAGFKGLSSLSSIKLQDDNSPQQRKKVQLQSMLTSMLNDGAFGSLNDNDMTIALKEFKENGLDVSKAIEQRNNKKH